MSIRREIVRKIVCDGKACRNWVFDHPLSSAESRGHRGWSVVKGEDFCPDCSSRRKGL